MFATRITADFRATHGMRDPRNGICATRKIAIFGAGNVVESRLAKALEAELAADGVPTPIARCYRVVIFADQVPKFDLPPGVEFHLLPSRAVDVSVIEGLDEAGMTGDDVLALLCTPDATHVPLIALLRGHVGRIASEKPLCLTSEDSVRVVRFAKGYDVRCYSHFLFKPELAGLLRQEGGRS